MSLTYLAWRRRDVHAEDDKDHGVQFIRKFSACQRRSIKLSFFCFFCVFLLFCCFICRTAEFADDFIVFRYCINHFQFIKFMVQVIALEEILLKFSMIFDLFPFALVGSVIDFFLRFLFYSEESNDGNLS